MVNVDGRRVVDGRIGIEDDVGSAVEVPTTAVLAKDCTVPVESAGSGPPWLMVGKVIVG